MKHFRLIPVLLLVISCSQNVENDQHDSLLEEIRATELAFSKLSEDQGIRTAFLTYAAEDAVLMRGGELIHGKEGIGQFYEDGPRDTTVNLTWSPDFIDVAKSGDLGYTYGKYVYTYRDSLGKQAESTGYFHTVWKKQADGEWRFVWD